MPRSTLALVVAKASHPFSADWSHARHAYYLCTDDSIRSNEWTPLLLMQGMLDTMVQARVACAVSRLEAPVLQASCGHAPQCLRSHIGSSVQAYSQNSNTRAKQECVPTSDTITLLLGEHAKNTESVHREQPATLLNPK
jgi:hypothetical protein